MRIPLAISVSLILQYQILAQNPYMQGSISDDGVTLMESATDMEIVGDYAYIASTGAEYGIEIINISDPCNPRHVGSLEDTATGSGAASNSIVVIDTHVFSIDKDGKLWTIDISDPRSPSTTSRIRLQNSGTNISIEYLYRYDNFLIALVQGVSNSIQKYDVSDPTNPIKVNEIPFDGIGLYSVQGDDLIGIYELTISRVDLSLFQVKPPIILPEGVEEYNAVYLKGNVAFCHGYDVGGNRLNAYDISNSLSPVLLSSSSPDSGDRGVIIGNNLYAVNFRKAEVLEITNPTYIPITGFIDVEINNPLEVLAHHNHLYVLSKKNGIGVLTILSIQGSYSKANNNYISEGVIVFSDLVQVNDYVLPATDGINGQVITTNGNGSLSWSSRVLGDPGCTNELQTIITSGSEVTLSNGGGTFSINDDDSNASNELQTLSKIGNSLQLSDGGGNVNLSSYLDSEWNREGSNVIYYDGDAVGIGTNDPQVMFQVGSESAPGMGLSSKWDTYSDIKLKKDIFPITNSMRLVQQLNGKYFNWKSNDQADIGFIAQEVEQVIPVIVSTHSDGYKSMDYSRIVPLLVEAIKEQQIEIDSLKQRLENIEKD